MTVRDESVSSIDSSVQLANLFLIENRKELTTRYRLLEVQGVVSDEDYEKNLQQLVTKVTYELTQPVALVKRGGKPYLAIPETSPLPRREQALTPYMAKLVPSFQGELLDFGRLDPASSAIARAFLTYALRTPLMRNKDLWRDGSAYFGKQPAITDSRLEVDVYQGFTWQVVIDGEGRLFLALDTRARYVDHEWLLRRFRADHPVQFNGRRCLYHYGDSWYVVQLQSVPGPTIREARFVDRTGETIDVYTYTRAAWRQRPPSWIAQLDPESPAILYRGANDKQRHGALALCKLRLPTDHPDVQALHRHSILGPQGRLQAIQNAITRYFGAATLGANRIRVAREPRVVPRRIFPIPPLRFGKGRVLTVRTQEGAWEPKAVPIEQYGRERLKNLLSSAAGPLDRSPFGPQFLLLPLSVPRAINEDFARRFTDAMQRVTGGNPYKCERLLYDDRGATTLAQQVRALQAAIAGRRGFALLVLPPKAPHDLHNYIKQALWPHVRFQCANAAKIRSFYGSSGEGGGPVVSAQIAGKYEGYMRHLALGMLVVNQKWPWALARPLHYDVYVNIDVLNRTAGFTCIYNGGEHIHFRDAPCKRKELLSTKQVAEVLTSALREDLTALGLRPQSIVAQRDGRSFDSEWRGVFLAVQRLKQEGLLSPDVVVGTVDVRKVSAMGLRLFESTRNGSVSNPVIGAHYVLNTREGVVATTGRPFRFDGTADPLHVVVADGDLKIEWVLEDMFAQAQLAFTAPEMCARLPIGTKLTDDFLEPIAGSFDQEDVLYDEEAEMDAEDGAGAADVQAG